MKKLAFLFLFYCGLLAIDEASAHLSVTPSGNERISRNDEQAIDDCFLDNSESASTVSRLIEKQPSGSGDLAVQHHHTSAMSRQILTVRTHFSSVLDDKRLKILYPFHVFW